MISTIQLTSHFRQVSNASKNDDALQNTELINNLCYETLSETNFSLGGSVFNPNLFLDISPYLKLKQEILGNYVTEISEHPFPRNLRAVRALAELRGSQSGFIAAEGFEIMFQRR